MKTNFKNFLFLFLFIFVTINAAAEQVTYQAEDFGQLKNRHPHYTGTGYHRMGLGTDNQLSVDKIWKGGHFRVIVRYALGTNVKSQTCKVTVNHRSYEDLMFPNTGSYSKWSEVSMDVFFDYRTNSITFEKNSTGAALNIDSITLVKREVIEQYELIVHNGRGDGVYNEFSEVKITASPAPVGMVFDHWEILDGNPIFDNPEASPTYIDIQDSNVEVIAVYSDGALTHKLIVQNGSGDGDYSYNEWVYITADPAPSGMVFDYWEVVYGDAHIDFIKEENTYLHMPAENVKISAKYIRIISNDENLVKNGSFEDGSSYPSNWWISGDNWDFSSKSIDGDRSLKLTGNGSFIEVGQRVAIEPNTTYELVVWAKINHNSTGDIFFSTDGHYDETCKFNISEGKLRRWKRLTGRFVSGRMRYVNLTMFAEKNFVGTCYFDNITLKKVQ